MAAKLHILKAGAEWCRPCVIMDAYIQQVVDSFNGDVELEKFDTGEDAARATELKIMAIPVLIFSKEGKEVHRVVGVLGKDALKEAISKLL